MIYHPLVLGPKLLVLCLLILLLVVLHGYLAPDQFRIAVLVAVAIFILFSIMLWMIVAKLLSNPDSTLAKQMVLSGQERAEEGFRASTGEFASLLGKQGVAVSPLRPAGTALLDDKRVSVVSEGEFIAAGARVEVIAVKGSRVVVQAASGAPRRSREEKA